MKTATAIVQMSPHLSANAHPPQHPALMLFKERIVVFTVYWIRLLLAALCAFTFNWFVLFQLSWFVTSIIGQLYL
jgi:hypothetical protein